MAKSPSEVDEIASQLLDELAKKAPESVYGYDFEDLKDLEATRKILDLEPASQVAVVRACVDRIGSMRETLGKPRGGSDSRYLNLRHEDGFPLAALEVLRRLLQRKLPFGVDDFLFILNRTADLEMITTWSLPFLGKLVTLVERFIELNGADNSVNAALERLSRSLEWHDNAAEMKLRRRIASLLAGPRLFPLHPGEAWSDAALSDVNAMDNDRKAAWNELLVHCQSAGGGKPSVKWTKTAEPLFESLGFEDFRSLASKWFPLVDKPRTEVIQSWSEWQPNPNLMIIDPHADILKGLAWCCSFKDDREIARALTALAISAYKKVPGIGPRAVKIGNACVYALGTMPGMNGVGQLALLKVRVKFGTAQKGIEKALVATAERVGIPREELEEMSVPAYGLSDVGVRREQLGEFAAELAVVGQKTELRWFKADGKRQKSVPAAVKKEFADDLKELKQAGKDIAKMIPAQAARIEQTYLQQKQWDFGTWQRRYLDHPLVGTLARRLIWGFSDKNNSASGIYHDGRFLSHADKLIEWIDDKTKVALWHPLDVDTEAITAWRDWLFVHEVKQPFKQAHREVYILTDAERNTRAHSNRFAAHVLRQHQFNALCAARGWKNTLRLMVDDEFPPARIELPTWSLRAEYWIEGAGDDYGVDTNEAGTYLYLTTDQVRFYNTSAAMNRAHAGGGGYDSAGTDREENHPMPLEEIPRLVFSEVMRDVDLFVGVASVGNDPNWADGGPDGRYRDYWQSYSFSELGATAQTRKVVLEQLIPRLKIAGRCSFIDRFLVVHGDLRTYKIHLGSSNILMEPTDEYLCIVPKQSTAKGNDRVFLPFEGDNTMAIILSKAFLLADDKKIKDPTIVTQIRGR